MSYALPVAAILVLLVGPIFWHFSNKSAELARAVDGFAIVAVGGLTLLMIAPGALMEGGLIALLLLVTGAALPRLLHRAGPRGAGLRADRVLLAGLVLHAAIESAALTSHGDGGHLGVAIVAHRIPVGLALFMLAPSARDGWIAVGLIVAASLLGFAGGYSISWLQPEHRGWLDGFVAGSLLHVLHGHHASHDHDQYCDHSQAQSAQNSVSPQTVERGDAPPAASARGHADHHHGHPDGHREGMSPLPSVLGAAAGAMVLAASLLEPHDHHGGDHSGDLVDGLVDGLEHPELLDQFMALALLSAPALLAGYVLAGLISGLMGASPARWLGRGGRLTQAGKGVAFGLPLPICSCGVLPVYESLLKRGAAPAAGLAFLIATPELGIDALAISLPLLGTELTVVRLVGALAVALGVALLLGGKVGSTAVDSAPSESGQPKLRTRLTEGLRFGLIELFDHTMPWVLLGLLLAALVAPLLDQALVSAIPAALQVPLLTLLAIPAYVCASGATPIAAVALQAGLSPGAAMAFLLAGPATNVTTFGILSRLHGRAFALKFGCAMAVAAMLVGWTMNLMTFNVPELGLDHDHAEGTPLQLISLGVLGLLALASLLRQGPRGMLTQVLTPFRS